MAGQRVLALCADDIGLVGGAAETALHLGQRGRLTAASCVTTTALWPSEARHFDAPARGLLTPALELGLHFNLSEGVPRSAALRRHWPRFPGLAQLIVRAHIGALPRAAIGDEWQAQLDAFTAAIGSEPQFVDGHQHVHHLPGVREIVLDGIGAFARPPSVRSTGHLLGPGSALKRRLIEATGGRALERALDARGVRRNTALLGAYDFVATDYRRLVQAWLAAAPAAGGLLFCHPSRTPAADDGIGAARRREAGYLDSDDFAADLAAAGVSLGSTWRPSESSSAG